MKIIITGGFGYLGGRLAKHLACYNNYDIILATRQVAKTPDWLADVDVLNIKWESSSNLEHICKGVHTVIHMAGMNVQESFANPEKALEFNAVSTNRLLSQ